MVQSRATRDAVLLRDGEPCTFVGVDGRRCTAMHNLQIDHIQPYAHGGMHDPENLRVLCGAHNRWRAERVRPTATSGAEVKPVARRC